MYERQDGSGLEVGSYAHRPILHDPEEIPSIEESALSPTELPFTQDDFVQQMEDALELVPEILGDESVGIKYAINGLLSLTPGRPADPRRDARGARALVRRRGVGQGGPGRRPRRRRVDGRGRARDRPPGLRRRALLRAPEDARVRAEPRRRGLQQDLRDRAPGRAVGVEPRRSGARRSTSASRRSARSSTRPPAGSARTGTSSNAPLLEEFADQVSGREAEWDSRWWSPIINAEHLAMRDRAAMFDLTAFCVFDIVGPGALECVQTRVDAADGREARQGRLHAGAHAARRLPLGPHRHAARRRALPRRHRRRARHGRPEVVPRPPARGRHGADLRPHLELDARSACGARGRATSSARSRARRRVARGLPVRHLPTRSRWARCACSPRGSPTWATSAGSCTCRSSRARGCGTWSPRRASRTAIVPGRHRRVRHHRPAREVLPRVRLRARRRVRRGRGRHGLGQGQGPGLRRQGGARAPPRGGPGDGDVHADRGRPHLGRPA